MYPTICSAGVPLGVYAAYLQHNLEEVPGERKATQSTRSDLAGSVEVLQTLLHSLRHGLLALTDPDSGIIVLLVRLVL